MKVTVVGAGIFGLCTALELSNRGHEVELIERGAIPNPESSSFDLHRLIRHAYGAQHGYAALIPDAFKAWDALWQHFGVSYYLETGALVIGETNHAWIKQSIQSLKDLDIPFEMLSKPQVEGRLPWMHAYKEDQFLFTTKGGILRASSILEAIAGQLRKQGCTLHVHTEINRCDFQNGVVYDDKGTRYGGDRLVFALGKGHSMLLPNELQVFRQVTSLHDNTPSGATVEDACPMVLDISDDHGFYYVPGASHFAAKMGDHSTKFATSATALPNPTQAEKENLATVSAYRLRDAAQWPVSKWQLCHYACTEDRTLQFRQKDKALFLFGGSGHGFKFGALFGELMCSAVEGSLGTDYVSDLISGKRSISNTF